MMYADDEIETQTIVQDALSLITDPKVSITGVLTPDLINALFINKNKHLMREFQDRLEIELRKLPLLVEEDPIKQIRAKIDNILAFIAYTEPQNGSHISVPSFINGPFENVDYQIQRINLTSDLISAPYTAYGLIPNNHPGAQARIIFMGTTFPTAKGFAQTLLADTAPGGGVGHYLYAQGKKHLQKWINQQYEITKQPVYCCGQSLGGAMSMQTYIHQPDKVEFTAINPPFLTNAEKRVLESNHVTKSHWNINNQIYSHIQDPIGQIGHWLPPLSTVCIHGTKEDFTGSEIHKYFKAHAAQLTTHTFSQYDGKGYIDKLESESDRMWMHFSLKPLRAAAFATFFATTATSSIVRSVAKYSGSYLTQAKGPQELPISHVNEAPPPPSSI